nr:AUGMIN subunit 6 [Ipomoea batatas]GME11289.1 AUGMIN subunit 6 [Ipomoea batatas]GME16875.1 AUGMIN subunit 6 [Ipomoea batatas]
MLSLFNNNGYQINIVWVLMNNSKNVWAKSQTLNVATFTLDLIPFITEEEKIWLLGNNGKLVKRWRFPWFSLLRDGDEAQLCSETETATATIPAPRPRVRDQLCSATATSPTPPVRHRDQPCSATTTADNDLLNDLDSFDDFDAVNGFLSAGGSNSSVSDAPRSFYDMDETPNEVFSPPLLMDASFLADGYEDLLAPLSETDAALIEH